MSGWSDVCVCVCVCGPMSVVRCVGGPIRGWSNEWVV